MDKNHSIETTDGIITVRFNKEPGFDEICLAIDDVADNYHGELRLWDLSCGLTLTNDQVQQLAEYSKFRLHKPARLAIVAPQDLSFGLLRMYEVYRKEEHINQKIFRSEQEARDWLKEFSEK